MEENKNNENNQMINVNAENNIDEILANSQNEVIKVLKIINNENKRRDAEVAKLKSDNEETKSKLETLEKNTNVLCSPFHSKRRKQFIKFCKRRVYKLFKDDTATCEYVLFSHFLFRRLYSDIAAHFDLDSWQDISMECYEQSTSQFSQAKEFAEYWTPNDWYIRKCIGQLVEKRDNGLLSPERCRALTEYLRLTNNGEINPFAA